MLCDTYSISSSHGVIVTLVRVREHQHRPANHRRLLSRLRFAWRLSRAVARPTPTTSLVDGIGPRANRAGGAFADGVRHPRPLHDDWYELLHLLPDSMRQTC